MIPKEVQKEIQNDNYNYSKTYFEELENGWNKISYPIISKLIKTCLDKYKPVTILDLGCGNGIYFDILKTYSKNIYGIDASEQSVILCSKKGYRNVKLADATVLPFPDRYFDFVFTSEVLQHIEDYIVMLKEIDRVLKPKGILLLTTRCYSTSIFQLNWKVSLSKFLKEIYAYIAGYISREKRNTFIRKYCFESSGHCQGFRPNLLMKDINNIGMTILEHKLLYIYPPFPHDPKILFESATSRKIKKSLIKRIFRFSSFLIVVIGNPVLKFFNIFANNVYLLAQRN